MTQLPLFPMVNEPIVAQTKKPTNVIRANYRFLDRNRPQQRHGRKVVRLNAPMYNTFGPCTMPPWAGTSGMSDETIAWLDEAFKEIT